MMIEQISTGSYGNMFTNLHKDGYKFVGNESLESLKGVMYYHETWITPDGERVSCTASFYAVRGMVALCACHPRSSEAHAHES